MVTVYGIFIILAFIRRWSTMSRRIDKDVWILSMIKAVGDERSIWNKADDTYKDRKIKAKAWKRVADKVNDEVEWDHPLTGKFI